MMPDLNRLSSNDEIPIIPHSGKSSVMLYNLGNVPDLLSRSIAEHQDATAVER